MSQQLKTMSAEALTAEPGKTLRLVLIEWLDSFGCSSTWEELAGDAPEPLLCRSVGYLLHDTTSCKVIVPHVTQDDSHAPLQGCGDMTIPACAIRKMVDLSITIAP